MSKELKKRIITGIFVLGFFPFEYLMYTIGIHINAEQAALNGPAFLLLGIPAYAVASLLVFAIFMLISLGLEL